MMYPVKHHDCKLKEIPKKKLLKKYFNLKKGVSKLFNGNFNVTTPI